MRKIIFYLLLFISTVSFGQTTIANKLKITAAIKDNLASRVMVQDSLTGELKWVLKNSLGTVKSVTGTSGVTVALGTSTPVIGLGAITPTSTNGVSATTMAYNDATSSIQTQLNGKQPVGTYATGTGSATGTNTGDNAVNTLYSGLVSNATHTGEVTGATALTITPKAVTLAKMDDVATGTVFYRKTAATGTPEVQTLATLKTDLGLTGTNSGDQTTVSGNAGTATTLQTGRTIAITGDLAYTSPTFNGSADVTATGTLATVNANVGSFTNANVTVNGKGLVTAASSGPTPQAALSGTGLVRSTAGAITYDTNAYITTVNGTAITPSSTNGVSAATMAFNDATSSIQTQLNGKQAAGTYATGTGTASGTNTGDNAVNSLYSGLVTNATHTGDATGATALTVKGINGTLLSGLATGILKNTTTTGVPTIATVRTDYAEPTTALGTGILKNTTTTGAHTIAVAADFPTLNQNTTGTASNITGVYGGTITSGQVTTALTFTPENAANKQNSLTVDGSGVKYSTVDAVNAGLATKQNTITNPVTGTGTVNYISKWTGAGTQGISQLTDDGVEMTATGSNTRFSGATSTSRFSLGNSSSTAYISFYGQTHATIPNDIILGTNSAGRVRFFTTATERASILANGNFLLGTTVDNGWKFRVNGGAYLDGNIVQSISDSRINGGDTVGRLIVSNSGTTTYLGLYGSAHATTPNTFSLVTNAAERINVNASGVVKISSLASGTSTQMVTADLNGNLGYQAIPSGGTTNLGYTASATNGVVASDTGTDATIPLADGTNAGLLAPAGYNAVSILESNTTDKTVWNNGKGNITSNVSFGDGTLIANTTGGSNTAIGFNVLVSNLTGNFNTALGSSALTYNTSSGNTALGSFALANNTSGVNNTAVGYSALTNSSGSNSIGIGIAAGRYITDGTTAATAIDSSILIGNNTKVLANSQTNQIVIGDSTTGNGSNTATIGNSSITDTYLKGAVRGGSFISTQVTPTAKTATATLTIAEILTDITTVTSTTAVTLTLPTGTLTDAGVQSGTLAVDESFEWTVINLGSSSGAVTMAAGTGHTYVGAASVAIGTSATFRTRKTAANTFVTYRI